MSETVRGVIVFLALLVTVGIWAPLRNHPERLPNGVVVSETYFGVFTYLTLRTELKEPNYKMEWTPDYGRLALTGLVTAGFWAAVIATVRKRKATRSGADLADAQ